MTWNIKYETKYFISYSHKLIIRKLRNSAVKDELKRYGRNGFQSQKRCKGKLKIEIIMLQVSLGKEKVFLN